MQFTVNATAKMYAELDALLAEQPKRYEEKPRLALYAAE